MCPNVAVRLLVATLSMSEVSGVGRMCPTPFVAIFVESTTIPRISKVDERCHACNADMAAVIHCNHRKRQARQSLAA